MSRESSVSIQDYLKTIYHLTEGDQPVSTGVLARRLNCTPAAVSQMLPLLSEKGWVVHQPYRGVRLTETGVKIAEEIVRHHRLLERYLVDHLGYDADNAHDEAERLEHHISEEFEAKIAEIMNDPDTCPHGSPIPPRR